MAPMRLLSHRQLELLVEFAEQNHEAAFKGSRGQQNANKAWGELAKRLNCLGKGLIKTPDKWRRYWHLLKCRTKAKASDDRRSHEDGTGGESRKLVPLSDLEMRIVKLTALVSTSSTLPVANEIKKLHTDKEPTIILDDDNMDPTTHDTDNCMPVFITKTNLKNKPHNLFIHKKRLEQHTTERQTVKHKNLALENIKVDEMQKEILITQLLVEKEKLEHNRLLQKMELKDAKEKYAHNKIMRNLEFDRFDNG